MLTFSHLAKYHLESRRSKLFNNWLVRKRQPRFRRSDRGQYCMLREAIVSQQLAPPIGPFAAAVRVAELLSISGQIGAARASGMLIAADVTAQIEQVFVNIRAVLRAAGKTLAEVVRGGVYLRDRNDFARMNAVYARQFDAPYPARTTIAVAALPMGAAVEIDRGAR
jgi:2-iminobutanoate/2-iminopropanoate deaminase